MFLHIPGMKLVLVWIPILTVLVNADSTSKLITKFKGKKIFKKEGQNLNLTWKYKINSLPPHGTKVPEFLFGEWVHPGYISRICLAVDENRNVVKAKNCEAKYGYKGHEKNGIYQLSVAIYNLTKSDMKRYGVYIAMGIYRNTLKDWFELQSFVKARITHFSNNSRNATVKQGAAVNITCRATGKPEPNVTLYKGNQAIKQRKGEVMHQIEAASKRQDAGEYVCVASNDDDEKSEDKRTIALSVEGRPKTPAPSSSSNKCFSAPWILGFLLFYRWF